MTEAIAFHAHELDSAGSIPRALLIGTSGEVASGPRDAAPVAKSADSRIPAQSTKRSLPLWPFLVAVGLAGLAAYIYLPRLYVAETDDAYVQADTISVVPKVAAYVEKLYIDDNSRFSAGELLVQLDPRDFLVAVDNAEANLQNALAAKDNIEQQLAEQSDTIGAADAAVSGDRATLAFAEQQLSRYGTLANDGAGTMERWQQAQSDIGERKATLLHDLAALNGAKVHLNVLKTEAEQANAMIATQRAVLAQAKLNLSYTKIYAEVSGTVANRTAQVGNYVQAGQVLFSAVPHKVYVIANFKEDQLTRMKVGQKVTVRVDAFPGRLLHAHIDSLQRGTGSYFALLPPENATGNFVKVVQRIPVKIIFDEDAANLRGVSPGMSVEPTVTVASPPGWLRPLL
jgi:membrane fusion protein, multidrug efflux system